MATLTVVPEDVTVGLKAEETILEALQRAGYAYRIGCRRGGCGICKVDIISGDVVYNRPLADKVLSDEERAEGVCVSCRAVPVADITITLRNETLRQVNPLLARLASMTPPAGAQDAT